MIRMKGMGGSGGWGDGRVLDPPLQTRPYGIGEDWRMNLALGWTGWGKKKNETNRINDT